MQKIDLQEIVLPGLNEGRPVNFGGVTTVEQLKEKILYDYVLLCRKCGYEDYCHFVPPQEDTCPLVAQAVSNFIDTTVRNVDLGNRTAAKEYAELTIAYVELLTTFVNWLGGNLDRDIIDWIGGRYAWFNHFWASRLQTQLNRFLQHFTVLDVYEKKKYVIFVEGDSEFTALAILLKHDYLDTYGIQVSVQNLGGKDKATPAGLENALKVCGEEGVGYFLILDNEGKVGSRVRKMIERDLIEEAHVRIWHRAFEDNFADEQLHAAISALGVPEFLALTLSDLHAARQHSRGVICGLDKRLFLKGVKAKLSGHKKRLAELLAANLVNALAPMPYHDILKGSEKTAAQRNPLLETLQSFVRVMERERAAEQIHSDFFTEKLQRRKIRRRK